MCQRVMIALALACRPSLLIADEPTTGLDVTTQAAVMDLITGLARERHMATLFITHDLALAADYCDRIVVMHAGHAVECAPTKALFAAPRHPYTARLMSSTPGERSTIASLEPVPGNLPDLSATTCRPAALPSAASAPPSAAAASGRALDGAAAHGVACWHPLREPALPEPAHAERRTAVAPSPRAPQSRRGPRRCCRSRRCTSAFPSAAGAARCCMRWTTCRCTSRRRERRPGRRIGLRQVHAGAAAGAAARPERRPHRLRRRRTSPTIRAERFARTPQRAAIQMVFQDPTDSPEPALHARARRSASRCGC